MQGAVLGQMAKHPWTSLSVTVGLLGTVLLGGVHSARAQGDTPAASYSTETAVDIGDGWRVTVGAVTIHTATPDAAARAPSWPLAASLTVQNLAAQPRPFPTDRLHLWSTRGAEFRDTWCRNEQSLEMVPILATNETATGVLCWLLPSPDTTEVALVVAPGLDRRRRRGYGSAFTRSRVLSRQS